MGVSPAFAANARPGEQRSVATFEGASLLRPGTIRGSRPFEDFALAPTEMPSLGGTPVDQVIVAGDALATSFQALADWETRRGVVTVVRSVDWIEEHYEGLDTPAKIRAFVRAAHDFWGTRWVILGGDTEHVPSRYVEWGEELVLSDLYYECLDREWNEDGDDRLGEPAVQAGSADVVTDLAAAPDGSIWVGTYAGVARYVGGAFTIHDFAHGLPSNDVYAVSVAPDGSVWVGTEAGASTYVDGSWSTTTIDQGLPTNRVLAILARSTDDVWAGTDSGVAHWDGTQWTSWDESDGLASNLVTGLAHDGSAIWIGTLEGATRFDGVTFTTYDTTNSGLRSNWVLGVDVDATGTVWFGHIEDQFGGGYSKLAGGVWSSNALVSIGSPSIHEFSFGPASGEWWAATTRGVLQHSGGTDVLYDATSGLPGTESGSIARILSGSLAVGQVDGLSIGAPGAWSNYNSQNGLPRPESLSDEIDLIPDVVAGRIPATDPAEVAAYLSKLRDYERGTNAAGGGTALFLGEVLFPTQDGKDICLESAQAFPPSLARVELYESDGTLDRASALARLNEGPGIVVHVSHGSYDVLGAGENLELLFNGDLDDVDAGGKSGLYVVYSCNSGGFDQNCSMEHLLFNPKGGAVATIANTREAVAWIDAEFNRTFFERLFAGVDARPAEALRVARQEYVQEDESRFQYVSWWRRMYLARSFLGAPTLSIWRGVPSALAVTHPSVVANARSPFEVVVKRAVNGLPLAGALVCVSKGSEDYVVGTTDSAGRVTFQFRPESPGLLEVVVTAPEHLPYEGTATVSLATGPSLAAAGWEGTGSVILGGGETRARALPLRFRLKNVGLSASTPWSVQLSSANPSVIVAAPAGTLAPVAAGQTGWTSPFTLLIGSDLPDGARVALSLTGTGPSTFAESFLVTIGAPLLTFDGFATVGDAIVPRVVNRGSIAALSIVATLESLTPEGVVMDGLSLAASLAPGASALVGDGFRVAGPANARFRLTLVAVDCASVALDVDQEAPEGVDDLRAVPTDGGAVLSWTPSPSDDVAAYRVQVRAASGAWNATPVAIARGVSSAHVAIPGGSSSEFLVLAIDASGNATADSARVFAEASPPTLAGWPARLSSIPGPTSLIARDLDGDGLIEIVLGSMWDANSVHAFRTNGHEWTNGDLDASTAGIFGTTNGRVNAAPLVVDIDADGACEIFATSYDGFVHGWRTNGPAGASPTTLPGWPIAIGENGGRTAPVAGDLDGDGALEIVTLGNDGLARAFESNGTTVPGWPIVTRRKSLGSTPAIADLNGDGRQDVVFGGTDSTLYVVSGDGTNLPGWPIGVGDKIISSPVLADVDGDGDFEIFVFDRSGRFHGYHVDSIDGVPGPDALPGWPVQLAPLEIAPPSPAVADFDHDGVPEFVVNGADAVVILRADGTHFAASPIVTGSKGMNSPVVADLDGDGALDILVGLEDRRLLALRPDGTTLAGWPWIFLEAPNATPAVADFDGDGRLDVAIAADDATLRVLALPTPNVSGVAPWPGYHGGPSLDGVYRPQPNPPVAAPEIATPPARLAFAPAFPNPFRDATEFRFELPFSARTSLEIIDVTGRRVASLLQGDRLEAGSYRRVWDGRDSEGRDVATGVYFIRLTAEEKVLTSRVLRLR